MALIKFSGIGIHSVSVTVPKTKIETISQTELLNKDQLLKFIETTGVKERRIADNDMCSSDLCYDAAMNLFDKVNVPIDEINALIFISQTPDYKVPGSSIILQDRLNLQKTTLAFDVNLTCSGYIYGLFLAYSLANNPGIDKVLLLVGETLSKITSMKDKSTGLLLGDGGSATLISKGEKYGDSFFSLNTDGSNYKSVIIPGGGFRNMSSESTLKRRIYEDGSERSDEQLSMDGMDVFSFAVAEIPKDVKNILNFAGMDVTSIDKVIFHQSNKYMMDVIAKKSKVDLSKMLYSIQKFGNTSGVSIPSAIADQKEQIENNDVLLLNAIGAGFSWGTAILKMVDCTILEIKE
ncbi:MAG: ketoacyl-ACP synthase III [Bacteroidales bacterium]|nr:ketoacyl-ACP synthase III [Bacteroidales bacterium]